MEREKSSVTDVCASTTCVTRVREEEFNSISHHKQSRVSAAKRMKIDQVSFHVTSISHSLTRRACKLNP